MKPVPNIEDIVAAKDWKLLVENSLPVNITDIYSFSEAMHIADHVFEASVEQILQDGFTADQMRDYSVNLMKILRAKYPLEWKKDWKSEAYLGISCALVFREEEAFDHIENAFKQLKDPPQSLILAYISAGSGPDQFLTEEQISKLSQIAIEKGVTYESALHMASLCYDQNDFEKQKYWNEKAYDAEKNGIHTPIIIPDVLKDLPNKNRGSQYEK